MQKTKVFILKTMRIIAVIMVIVACIISIPIFIACAIGIAIMYPGLRMWQFSSDKLDEYDIDPDPRPAGQSLSEYYGRNCCSSGTPKCAK